MHLEVCASSGSAQWPVIGRMKWPATYTWYFALGCTYNLHSSHHFLSTWGVVMLNVYEKKTFGTLCFLCWSTILDTISRTVKHLYVASIEQLRSSHGTQHWKSVNTFILEDLDTAWKICRLFTHYFDAKMGRGICSNTHFISWIRPSHRSSHQNYSLPSPIRWSS